MRKLYIFNFHQVTIHLNWIVIFFVFAVQLQATPRFALATGSPCITCHVNPTGGGMRNDYGQSFAIDDLPMQSESDWAAPWPGGQITDWLRVGGDFRVQALNHEGSDSSRKTPLFAMQSDIYGQILLNDRADILFKTGLDPTNTTPEFWINFRPGERDNYFRIGRFLPNYGMRVDDHTAYIRGGNLRLTHGLAREGMPFSPMIAKPTALEVGLYPSRRLQLTASVSNGFIRGLAPGYGFDESLGEKNYTAGISYRTKIAAFKLQAATNIMVENEVTLSGGYWGIGWGDFGYLGEIDWAKNYPSTSITSQAVFQEVSYELRQGVSILARYEYFDPDLANANGALTRWDLGIDLFPASFGEIQLHLRQPVVEQNGNMDTSPIEVFIQLHTWF